MIPRNKWTELEFVAAIDAVTVVYAQVTHKNLI